MLDLFGSVGVVCPVGQRSSDGRESRRCMEESSMQVQHAGAELSVFVSPAWFPVAEKG